MSKWPTCKNPHIERFHYCNARVISWYDPKNEIYTWELVSYNTAVCRLKFKTRFGFTAVPTGELIIVAFGRYAKCSATTWRQVYRFVYEYAGHHSFSRIFSTHCRGYNVSRYGMYVDATSDVYAWAWACYEWDTYGGVRF